jgi:DNA-binding NtrC family response regulator
MEATLCSEKEVLERILEETGWHYRQVETTVHCQIGQIEKLYRKLQRWKIQHKETVRVEK